MTPEQAFGILRSTFPDIVDGVIHDGIGLPATHHEAHDLVEQMRHASTLEQAMALDEKLSDLADTDPPFRDAILARTQGLRDKADAESPAGQVKQAMRNVESAAKAGASLAKDVGTVALVGLGLWVLAEAGSFTRTLRRGGHIT